MNTLEEITTRPAEEVNAELLAPEQTLGEDERTRCANDALRSLARASRSYLIYDPRNDAIKAFLQEVKETFDLYAQKYGDLELDVRPFEMVLNAKVVYLERDRERSLAYKLFRDGVRKVVIREDVSWDELTHLLEILSIRYVGIHMNEDDILTLLWKASFRNIDIEAIEGFTLDEEDDIDAGASGAAIAQYAAAGDGADKAPRDFDLPAPILGDPVRTLWTDVSDDEMQALRGELSSSNLPERVIELTRTLLEYAADPTDPLDYETCRFYFQEIRDFMMSEAELSNLLTVLDLLRDFVDSAELDEQTARSVAALQSSFTSPSALHRLLQGLPRNISRPPPEFKRLLELSGADPVPVLLDMLTEERVLHVRRFTSQLIELYMPARAEAVLARYRESGGAVAADMLKILGAGAPAVAQQAFQELVRGGDTEVKLEFLSQVEADPEASSNVRSFLVLLMSAPEVEVRTRAMEVIAGRGERGAFKPVQSHAEACARKGDADEYELDVCGESLARINPRAAMELFNGWARPRGILGLVMPRQLRLRRVAMTGLAVVPDEAAEALLRELATARDPDTSDTARAALVKRRRLQSGDAGEAPAEATT